MPAMASRGRGRGRRTISEINMVPFIDVMLVLLIIFMVSAPMISTGVVDLPTVGKSQKRPEQVIELVIEENESIKMRVNGKDQDTPRPLKDWIAQIQRLQTGQANTPVIISADKDVRYDLVVRTMDQLQRAGVSRVGLSVKTGG